ncbi:hypothetical protein C6T66_24155 [Burkholderia multivorans]|uniref:Uncharacterized protein n=1 Tax=Burkholderia multivorans TaxID=87883 RepID=A0A8E2RWU0_9BURK|nr:hypothetical protein C6P76_03280 [Burkholderia multivorans]PRF24859.1 hypothetical protein C6P98_10005 [Burkholderia multivorans]PRG82514.1 hypothetical protein C6T66_24155 [Burkholderia multivorans]
MQDENLFHEGFRIATSRLCACDGFGIARPRRTRRRRCPHRPWVARSGPRRRGNARSSSTTRACVHYRAGNDT